MPPPPRPCGARSALRVSDDGPPPPTNALTCDDYAAPEARLVSDVSYAPLPKPDPYQPEYAIVRLSGGDMERLQAQPGDLLYVGDARWWLGGPCSLHCRAGTPHAEGNVVLMHADAFDAGSFLPGRAVRVEKMF